MVMRVALGLAFAGALAGGCKQKTEPPSAPAAQPAASAPPAPPPSPSGPAPSPPPRAAPPGEDPCPTICAKTKPLKCKRASACPDVCREMRNIEACGAEMAVVLSCFARQPLSSWECGQDGDATIKDGFCDKPQAVFTSCVEHGGPPGAKAL
jgi:hypothetical protein